VGWVHKALMLAFRVMPGPLRRAAVRVGTPSYTLGAVLVLRRSDGHVLLVDQRHTGGWALPGGLLRRGETPAVGLAREVGEEVGIHLRPEELPEPLTLVDAHAQRVDFVYVMNGRAEHASVEDDAEVRRVGWFAVDDLPDMTEPTRDIIASVS
jgi:8-oxo-dGTP diphosphatase